MVSDSGGGRVVVRTTGSDLPDVELSFSSTREFEEVYARFLSYDGLYVCADEPLAASSVLRFRIKVAGDFVLAEGNAVVIWTIPRDAGKDLPPGMAVRFISLSGQSKEVIDQIVDRHGQPFNLDRTLDEIEVPPRKKVVETPASPAVGTPGATERKRVRSVGTSKPALKLTVRGADEQALPPSEPEEKPAVSRPAPQQVAKPAPQQVSKPAAQVPRAQPGAAARPVAKPAPKPTSQSPAARPRQQAKPAAEATAARPAATPQPERTAPKPQPDQSAVVKTLPTRKEPAKAVPEPAAEPAPPAAPKPRPEVQATQEAQRLVAAPPAREEPPQVSEPEDQATFDFSSPSEQALELETEGGGELALEMDVGGDAVGEPQFGVEDEHTPSVVPSAEDEHTPSVVPSAEDEHAPSVVPSAEDEHAPSVVPSAEDEHTPSVVPSVEEEDDMFRVQPAAEVPFEPAPEMAPAPPEHAEHQMQFEDSNGDHAVEEDTLVFSEEQVAAVELNVDLPGAGEAAGDDLDKVDTDTGLEVEWGEQEAAATDEGAEAEALPQMEEIDVGEAAGLGALAEEPATDADHLDDGRQEELPSVELGDTGAWASPEAAIGETTDRLDVPEPAPQADLEPALDAPPPGPSFDEPAAAAPAPSTRVEDSGAPPSGPTPESETLVSDGLAGEGLLSGPSPFLRPSGEGEATEPLELPELGSEVPASPTTSTPDRSEAPAAKSVDVEPAPPPKPAHREPAPPRPSSSARRGMSAVGTDTTLGFDELSMPAKPKKERRPGVLILGVGAVFVVALVGGFFAKDLVLGMLGMRGSSRAAAEQPGGPELPPDDGGPGQTTQPGDSPPVAVEPTPEPRPVTVAPTPKPQQPKPTAVPPPVQPRPTSAVQTSAPATAVADIEVEQDGASTVVVISGNGSFSGDRFKALPMASPPRVLVRLDHITEGFPKATISAGTPELTQIRIGHHPDKRPPQLFVVLDLAADGVRVTDSRASGSTIRVRLSR